MSNLPGFRKSGVTKFSELEMEDTFLHNLQVMNTDTPSERNIFLMGDSILRFEEQNTIFPHISELSKNALIFSKALLPTNIAITAISSNAITLNYKNGINNEVHDLYLKSFDGQIPPRIEIHYRNADGSQEKTDTLATTEQVGITKSSQMTGDFWDSDLEIPNKRIKIIHGDTNTTIDSNSIKCSVAFTGFTRAFSLNHVGISGNLTNSKGEVQYECFFGGITEKYPGDNGLALKMKTYSDKENYILVEDTTSAYYYKSTGQEQKVLEAMPDDEEPSD